MGGWNPCMTERNQLGEANESISVEGPGSLLNKYAHLLIQNDIDINKQVEFHYGNSQVPIQSLVDNTFQHIRGPINYVCTTSILAGNETDNTNHCKLFWYTWEWFHYKFTWNGTNNTNYFKFFWYNWE